MKPRRANLEGLANPSRFYRSGWAAVFGVLFVIGSSPRFATAVGRDVIYVKILVDEEERTAELVWQARLRQRLENASTIISQYCGIKFTVQSFESWRSDNRITDLNRTLGEFEQEVPTRPAQIAIGFSSQYRFQKGQNGMGGTRGPLHSHIILRENAPTTQEPDRLEALVHELGHFLGAAHSKNANSAMRPIIGDGRARSPTYHIGFDKHNTRVIRLVANEVSIMGARRFRDLSSQTISKLEKEYRLLAEEMPTDPAAQNMLKIIDRVRQASASSPPRSP